VEEFENGSAILSSHDLCCVEFLEDIAAAGVRSFKIEGRMKTAYYVATAVNAYRRVMDGLWTPAEGRRELECLKHRPYSSGFYFGALKTGHRNSGQYEQSCTFVGRAAADGAGRFVLEQRNCFALGETLEILAPGEPVRAFPVTALWDEAGAPISRAPHPRQRVTLACPWEVKPGAFLRRREA